MSRVAVLILVLLLLFMFGVLPGTGLHTYGWGPSGFLGVLLVVVIVLALLGVV